MTKDDDLYNEYIEILKSELVPAMGCTEPIALAYAAAKLKDILGFIPEKTVLEVCGNIIKNVKSVVVPQTNGLKGIPAAISAGYFANDSSLELEVLTSLEQTKLSEVKAYILKNNIDIIPSKSDLKFYIDIKGIYKNHEARVVIANKHTNIVLMQYDGKNIFEANQLQEEKNNRNYDKLNIKDIVEFVDCLDVNDLRDVLERQIRYNLAIAEEGLKNNYGANIGKVLLDNYPNTPALKARAYAAAASDARMSGCALPVIIVSGSGNQGITASLPVYVYAKEENKSEELMLKALALSDLVTLDQKRGIGRLSAFCGATCAGVGAATGIAYLEGGNYETISHTIVNALAIISGMVCDGAKPSCAAKISAAIDSGIFGYYMYKHNEEFLDGEGLVTKGVDHTIDNVCQMARLGMCQTDEEILKIMVSNKNIQKSDEKC